MEKIITVSNHKGGVGKTTLSNTLGLGLAFRGYKVVLVDADAQATLTQYALGFEPEPGLYDLLVRNAPFNQVVKAISPDQYEVNGTKAKGWAALVPGNGETRHIADSVSNVTTILSKFKPLLEAIDFIIFDPSPTESLLHPLTYVASDYILHPTLAEDWSVGSLYKTMQYVEAAQAYRKGLGLSETITLGVVPTMVRANTITHRTVLEELESQLPEWGVKLWKPIPQSIHWSEAAGWKKPVFSYMPDSDAALEAWEFIDTFESMVVRHG